MTLSEIWESYGKTMSGFEVHGFDQDDKHRFYVVMLASDKFDQQTFHVAQRGDNAPRMLTVPGYTDGYCRNDMQLERKGATVTDDSIDLIKELGEL